MFMLYKTVGINITDILIKGINKEWMVKLGLWVKLLSKHVWFVKWHELAKSGIR